MELIHSVYIGYSVALRTCFEHRALSYLVNTKNSILLYQISLAN